MVVEVDRNAVVVTRGDRDARVSATAFMNMLSLSTVLCNTNSRKLHHEVASLKLSSRGLRTNTKTRYHHFPFKLSCSKQVNFVAFKYCYIAVDSSRD